MSKVEVQALHGVTLGIAPGAFISVMGPSGSGKSTLLNILGCMDRPSQGTVLLDSVDLAKAKPRQLPRIRREKLGFVFQHYQLLGHLTALENVMLPLRYTESGDEILNLMRALNEAGQTFIIVTHNPREAERTGHTIYLRDGGVESEVRRTEGPSQTATGL